MHFTILYPVVEFKFKFFFLPHILHSCFIPFVQECIAGGGAGLCVVVGRKWAGHMYGLRKMIVHCGKGELLKYMYVQ